MDARILYKECKALAKAGHDVTLVARHERDETIDGVKVKALRTPKGRLKRWTAMIWRVYREAARQNADLYHFHDPELIPVGVWLSLRGQRVIYDAHEDFPNTFPYKSYLPACARKLLGWLAGQVEMIAVPRFAGVVAATPTIAKRFYSQNANTVVVRNFPVLEEFARRPGLGWDERPPLIVYVGSMFQERGFREAIAATSLLPAQLNASQTRLATDMGQAGLALQNSKYDQANSKLQELLAKYPATPFLHYVYGTALASLSQYNEAEVEFRKETAISPSNELPFIQLASLALRQHQPANALPSGQHAVQLAPNSAQAHYILGRIYLEIEQYAPAVNELEAAKGLAPTSPEVHFNLARAYAKSRMPVKAEQERAEFARLKASDDQQSRVGQNQPYTGLHIKEFSGADNQ